jgi:hypothetical protein
MLEVVKSERHLILYYFSDFVFLYFCRRVVSMRMGFKLLIQILMVQLFDELLLCEEGLVITNAEVDEYPN